MNYLSPKLTKKQGCKWPVTKLPEKVHNAEFWICELFQKMCNGQIEVHDLLATCKDITKFQQAISPDME